MLGGRLKKTGTVPRFTHGLKFVGGVSADQGGGFRRANGSSKRLKHNKGADQEQSTISSRRDEMRRVRSQLRELSCLAAHEQYYRGQGARPS
jgi:hypothetical protein